MLNKLSKSKTAKGEFGLVIVLLLEVAFLPVIIGANTSTLSAGAKIVLSIVDVIVIGITVWGYAKKNGMG